MIQVSIDDTVVKPILVGYMQCTFNSLYYGKVYRTCKHDDGNKGLHTKKKNAKMRYHLVSGKFILNIKFPWKHHLICMSCSASHTIHPTARTSGNCGMRGYKWANLQLQAID